MYLTRNTVIVILEMKYLNILQYFPTDRGEYCLLIQAPRDIFLSTLKEDWSGPKSKSHYDRQSVRQSVLVSGAHLGPVEVASGSPLDGMGTCRCPQMTPLGNSQNKVPRMLRSRNVPRTADAVNRQNLTPHTFVWGPEKGLSRTKLISHTIF
jgi:hypothetical protein